MAGRPSASKATSAPPRVARLIALRSSPEPARIVSVAPDARASASAGSVTSTATIGCAPAARKPWTMHWPTPPQPNTTARSPGRTCAVLKTAPTPVIAAQPISAATSRSVPPGSSTACVAGITTCSAKHAVAMKWPRSRPRARRRELPSGMRWRCDPISQSAGEPEAHQRQRPQAVTHASATASSTFGASTPGPTASTTPAPSWPSTIGRSYVQVPSITCRSERQTPAAAMRTRTSPACGSASSTSSTLSGAPDSHSTAARISMRAAV